jgi:hypothetical protein
MAALPSGLNRVSEPVTVTVVSCVVLSSEIPIVTLPAGRCISYAMTQPHEITREPGILFLIKKWASAMTESGAAFAAQVCRGGSVSLEAAEWQVSNGSLDPRRVAPRPDDARASAS